MSCVTCPCWRRGDLRISWNVSARPVKGFQFFPRRSSTLSFILSMLEIDLGLWVLVTLAWRKCFCPVISSSLDISWQSTLADSTSYMESRKCIWDLAIENQDLERGEVSTGGQDSLLLLAGLPKSLQPESSYLPLFFKGGYSTSIFPLLFCTQAALYEEFLFLDQPLSFKGYFYFFTHPHPKFFGL